VTRRFIACVRLCIVGLVLATPAAAEDPVVQDVLDILKERGIVDDSQYTELSAKNTSYEEEHRNLLGRIEFTGDFRFRLENFWYDRDVTGVDRDNRTRMRYRLRVQGKAEINDSIDAVFRLASGEALNFQEGDNRSTNRTLGRGNDFSYDAIFIDLAYLDFDAPESWLGADTTLGAQAGKMKNPFRWKIGKDYLLWDSDVTPEGIAAQAGFKPAENWDLFVNTGYFILDENSTASDPHVWGIQGGAHVALSEDWKAGARASFYSWRSLNGGFFGRSASFGAIPDGLTAGAPTTRASTFGVVEASAYVGFEGLEGWPVLLWGHYVKNLDAQDSTLSPAAHEEDTGWGIGVEMGDKKNIAAFGLGYYHIEANFWPAQFMDSDLSDGVTNRSAWTIYGSKQVLPNTDLAVTLFWSDELRGSLPDFEESASNAERVRLQTDIIVKF